MKLTAAQIYALARQHGGLGPTEAVIATAIALAESGGDTEIHGDTGITTEKWGPSIGLWQIRSLNAERGTGNARDASKLTDPVHNARAMGEISGSGKTWQPWSVYTSGAYKKQLPAVKTGVESLNLPGGVFDLPDFGNVPDAIGEAAGAVGDKLADLSPFAVFEGWQDDLTGVAVKLAVGGAALWLIVAGVKAATGGEE